MSNEKLCDEIIRLLKQRDENANRLRLECQDKNKRDEMIQHLGESYGLLTAIEVVESVRTSVISGLMEE